MSSEMTLLNNTRTVRRGDLWPEDFDKLRSSSISAWDIETSGLEYRASEIGTVQIADEAGNAWVVQVEQGRRPDLLGYLLTDASIRKLFHFAPFDLGFMRFHWGVRAQNVACTKVLDRLVHPDASSHSLKEVLHRELEVNLSKREDVRRSNWSVEDLTEEQLSYAVEDVVHLISLYDVLMEKATRQGVSRLAEQSFEYLPVRVETELLGIQDVYAY